MLHHKTDTVPTQDRGISRGDRGLFQRHSSECRASVNVMHRNWPCHDVSRRVVELSCISEPKRPATVATAGGTAERNRRVSGLCPEQSGPDLEHEAGLGVRASAQLTDRIAGRHGRGAGTR